MKIHRNPTKKEVQDIEKLIESYAAVSAEAESIRFEIDSIFGNILFGVSSATDYVSKNGTFERQISKNGLYEIPYAFVGPNLPDNEEEKQDLLNAFIGVEASPKDVFKLESHYIEMADTEAECDAFLRLLARATKKEMVKKFDYQSDEFRMLRHKVFLRDGERCAKCGAKHSYNNWLEIDHIKPVSKYPALVMDIDNLQVLCRNCNRLKSNIDETDYRRKRNGAN